MGPAFRVGLWALALTLLWFAPTRPLGAQAPATKAVLIQDTRPGRRVPDLKMPYVTKGGPGPADQDFRLSAELGRTVVLLFYPRPAGTEADSGEWGAVTRLTDSLLARGVVMAAVGPDRPENQVAFASQTGFSGKLLSDSNRLHRLRFGLSGDSGWAIFLVDQEGVIRYRDLQFSARDATSLARFWARLNLDRNM